jgi:peptidoglycan/LPS O-acetylase OafA/YrhL
LNLIQDKIKKIKTNNLLGKIKLLPTLIPCGMILLLILLYTFSSYSAYHFLLSFDDYVSVFIFVLPVVTSLTTALITTVFELTPVSGPSIIPCMILGWIGCYAYPLYLFHYLIIFVLDDCPNGICSSSDLLQREGFVFFISVILIFFMHLLQSGFFALKKLTLKR